MNLVAGAPWWLILLFGLAMVAAAIEDAARFRISNLTSLVILAGAIAAAVIVGPSWRLWQNVVVFAAILGLGTWAFSAGWLGGGDVKLFAAVGLWFDLHDAVSFVALVLLAGGLIAIAYVMARPLRRERKKKDRRVPYGIAIALGALAMVLISRGPPSAHERAFSPLTNSPSGT